MFPNETTRYGHMDGKIDRQSREKGKRGNEKEKRKIKRDPYRKMTDSR